MSPNARMSRRRRQQEGSAFVLALIAVLLLTILGISVVVVAETEMQLGATEKTVERQLYAAETGLWTKIAGLAVSNYWARERLAMLEPPETGYEIPGKTLGYAIESTSVKELARHCPGWSDCDEAQSDNQFWGFFVLLGSTAKRVGWPSSESTPFDTAGEDRFSLDASVDVIGQQTIGLATYIGPIEGPGAQDLPTSFDQVDGFKELPTP